MASIAKRNVEQEAAARDEARERNRMEALQRGSAGAEHRAEEESNRYSSPDRNARYAEDLKLAQKARGFDGTVDYRFIGNKKLRVTGENEITRERGYFTKVRKVTRSDADGNAYVAQRQTENRRKQETVNFNPDGTLAGKHVIRKDKSFEEKWERDEKGNLMRTDYFSSRKRDGNFSTAVSEQMSGPKTAGDGKTYRYLTRTKGSDRKVFERDEDGKLELLERTTKYSSLRTQKSDDRQTSSTQIERAKGLFKKSYTSRLDESGQEIGRDMTSHRRLLNKRSASYDETSGQVKAVKHTVGKLYKSDTTYLDDQTKRVKRKILGVTVSTKLKDVTDSERQDQAQRRAETGRHREAWAKKPAIAPSVVAVPISTPAPSYRPGTPKQNIDRQVSVDSLSERLQGSAPEKYLDADASSQTSSIGKTASFAEPGEAVLRAPDRAPSPYDFSFSEYASTKGSASASILSRTGSQSTRTEQDAREQEFEDKADAASHAGDRDDFDRDDDGYASSVEDDRYEDNDSDDVDPPPTPSVARKTASASPVPVQPGTLGELMARVGKPAVQNAMPEKQAPRLSADEELAAYFGKTTTQAVEVDRKTDPVSLSKPVAVAAMQSREAPQVHAPTPQRGTLGELMARVGKAPVQHTLDTPAPARLSADDELAAYFGELTPPSSASSARTDLMQRPADRQRESAGGRV